MAGLVSARGVMSASLLALLLCCVASYGAGMESDDESKGMLAGGATEIPVDGPEVKRLANFLVEKLSEGDKKEVQLVQITKATRQVVAGTLTHLTFTVKDDGEEFTYEASVWEQPWLNKTEITRLTMLGQDKDS